MQHVARWKSFSFDLLRQHVALNRTLFYFCATLATMLPSVWPALSIRVDGLGEARKLSPLTVHAPLPCCLSGIRLCVHAIVFPH